MTNYKPYILLALGLILAFFWFRDCNRKPEPLEKIEQLPAETTRQRVVTGRDKMNEQLAADTLKYLAQNKALSATISRLMANGKQKDRELAALYAKYRKKPTLAGCDTLVREQKSRIDSLKAEVSTHRQDSLNKANMLKVYAEHLFDKDLRIDSLNTIAKDANKKLAKKPLKVYATAAFEQHPLNNNLKVGSTVTRERWLLSYQRGIIEKSNEVKAGVLLW